MIFRFQVRKSVRTILETKGRFSSALPGTSKDAKILKINAVKSKSIRCCWTSVVDQEGKTALSFPRNKRKTANVEMRGASPPFCWWESPVSAQSSCWRWLLILQYAWEQLFPFAGESDVQISIFSGHDNQRCLYCLRQESNFVHRSVGRLRLCQKRGGRGLASYRGLCTLWQHRLSWLTKIEPNTDPLTLWCKGFGVRFSKKWTNCTTLVQHKIAKDKKTPKFYFRNSLASLQAEVKPDPWGLVVKTLWPSVLAFAWHPCPSVWLDLSLTHCFLSQHFAVT